MIYFYGKLHHKFKQIKIEPNEGKNFKLESKEIFQFFIDFGFEGYNPLNILTNTQIKKENGIVYIENLYDKLETQLVKDEYLFIYYESDNKEDIQKENIGININSPYNEYGIYFVPKNSKEKNFNY
jgi:hypothetical protein